MSGLWQIHPFGEGNTRTTAVFTILYLRHIGFKVENDLFANNSWYFRNALVRANYKNAVKGIDYSPVYLERFFRNLLMGEQWDLRNRYLHISPSPEWQVQPQLGVEEKGKSSVEGQKGTEENIKSSEKILRLIQNNPSISARELAEKMGQSARNIEKHLRNLRSKHRIRRLGPTKGGYWEVLG